MRLIARKTAISSFSLCALGFVVMLLFQSACTSGGGTPSGKSSVDAGTTDSSSHPVLGFSPSNINLAGIDLSKIADEDVSKDCSIHTDNGNGGDGCFAHSAVSSVVQSDGSKVYLLVVKSLTLEPTGHITVTGGLPLVIVSLGDMALLGPIDVEAGGFKPTANPKGGGPGGGAGPTGNPPSAAAGGGSYCGQGGQGAVEFATIGAAAAPTASYGTPGIVPLVGGSSGGNGGGYAPGVGGGALQFVAGGKFSLGPASYINVGGGGGMIGFSSGSGYEASGGGSGGSILIEAATVTIAGLLAANGGGGGGGGNGQSNGQSAMVNAIAAAGGGGDSVGGLGGAGASVNGASATASTKPGAAGAGGGAAGRIRINSTTGSADLTGAIFSPDMSTICATQGQVAS